MIGRLHHVGIATSDLAGALAFYGTVLGMKVTSDEALPSHGVRAVFLAGESDAYGEIELLLPLGDDSPIARFLARRGPGMHHVAFEVPDIAAAIAVCRSRNVRLIDETPRPGARGHLVAFLHPEAGNGVLVELVQVRES